MADDRFVCKCDCGGDVRGVEQFGRLWTWCEKCSPRVTIKRAGWGDYLANVMRATSSTRSE